MSDTTLSPNMGLTIPTVSVDPGPDWATNINASLQAIDQHNHSPNNGAQINQAGINLLSTGAPYDSLGFNQTNAFNLRSARFFPQTAPLNPSTVPSDIGCIYVAGADLYYNDTNNNQVQLTSGGAPAGGAGTITGLPSGTAGAKYSSSTFTFTKATSTAANVDAGSYILRNSSASSYGLTLQPPNSLAANYSITLPANPASLSSTSFLTLDSSGNMGASIASPLTGSNIASNTVARSNLVAVGQQVSSSCGNFLSSNTSYVNVTNLSVTITTSGRPVMVFLQADGQANQSFLRAYVSSDSIALVAFRILRNGSVNINQVNVGIQAGTGTLSSTVPPASLFIMDVVGAGTYTYTVQTAVLSGASALSYCQFCVLVAYEL